MYHFIGIKGSGMASLATILNDLGYTVQGSDIEKHFFTEIGLKERNIKIFSYNEKNIVEGLTIIKGASIKEDNPELTKDFLISFDTISTSFSLYMLYKIVFVDPKGIFLKLIGVAVPIEPILWWSTISMISASSNPSTLCSNSLWSTFAISFVSWEKVSLFSKEQIIMHQMA